MCTICEGSLLGDCCDEYDILVLSNVLSTYGGSQTKLGVPFT